MNMGLLYILHFTFETVPCELQIFLGWYQVNHGMLPYHSTIDCVHASLCLICKNLTFLVTVTTAPSSIIWYLPGGDLFGW